jgi:polyisoprenoid-binding protein YceI
MSNEIATAVTQRQLPPGSWAVNATASRVGFEVGNLWGLAKVRGEFESVRGALAVGPDSVDGQLTIDASSLNTRNERRDKHLRSADFFGVEQHPEIVFETLSATLEPGGLTVTGSLHIGESRIQLSLPVEVDVGTDRLIVSASTPISRELVGLAWNRLGMIGPEALVSVQLMLIRDA